MDVRDLSGEAVVRFVELLLRTLAQRLGCVGLRTRIIQSAEYNLHLATHVTVLLMAASACATRIIQIAEYNLHLATHVTVLLMAASACATRIIQIAEYNLHLATHVTVLLMAIFITE